VTGYVEIDRSQRFHDRVKQSRVLAHTPGQSSGVFTLPVDGYLGDHHYQRVVFRGIAPAYDILGLGDQRPIGSENFPKPSGFGRRNPELLRAIRPITADLRDQDPAVGANGDVDVGADSGANDGSMPQSDGDDIFQDRRARRGATGH
jgi:hypothetical protein